MAILSKGTDFATGEQVTAARLDALVDNATFASGAVDGSTTQLNGSGAIIVKDGGITSAKLNLSATGQSQTIASFNTTQTDGSGNQVGRSVKINTPAADDLNSPFEFETLNAFVFKVDDHTVTIDSNGKTIFGTGNIPTTDTGLHQVNINTDGTLGTTEGNSQGILRLVENVTGNTDNLLFTSQRVSNGSDWQTAAHRIQRKVDATKMGYIQFGNHTASNGGLITFGENETERMRIDAEGHVGIGTTTPSEALEVSGNILATNGTESVQLANNGSIEIRHSSGPFIDFKNANENRDCRIFQTSDGLGFQVGGSSSVATKMVIASDGDVGIGDTAPDGKLHVGTGNDSDGTDLDIVIGGSTANQRQSIIRKKIQSSDKSLEIIASGNTSTNDIKFFSGTGSNETVRIKAGGNVGIGTPGPNAKLEVRGATLVSDDGLGDFVKQHVSGTTSAISLGATQTSSDGEVKLEYNRSSGKFHNYIGSDASINYMTVTGGGNVGLGTDSAGEKLVVDGNITATGNVTADSVTGAEDNDFLILKSDPQSPTPSTGGSQIQLFSADSGQDSQIYHRGKYHIFQTLGGTQVVSINSNAAQVNVTGRLEFDALKGTGSTEVTNILDQDNMSSNSASALATQQSIRAFTAMSPIQNGSGGGYTGGESVTFPNGLILKMGKTGDVVQDGDTTVSFDSDFPNEIISLVITKEGAKNVGGNGEITASNVSVSGFVYNNGSDSTGKCNYMAMGR